MSIFTSKLISVKTKQKDREKHSKYTSYATLSSGILWNIHESLVCSRYTREPLGELVYQENTSDKWVSMVYHEKVLHNYFIPRHRKYAN